MGAALATSLASGPLPAAVHEVPQSVLVRAFVRAEGDRLRLLVRVPAEAMRDVIWPLRGPGYLELSATDTLLAGPATTWLVHYATVYENGAEMQGGLVVATRISLPSDQAFANYETALASIRGPPLPRETELAWQQAMIDVLIEYPIHSADSRFSINPEWAHLGVRTTTVLRYITTDGNDRAFQYAGDPGLVHLDPRWHQAAFSFVKLGFRHILEGIDHLLFVFCLVIPFRRVLPLIGVVTAFTVAHSITLVAAALGFAPSALWFPPLVETLIAASILLMALENIVGAKLQRRWIVAFVFGLVHGFGFSFALSESLQFAGTHLATSLLSFNVGVELGQILVLAIAVPALNLLFRYGVAERMGVILLSALVAHTAWHWTAERAASLTEYEYRWPAFDAGFVASVLRLLMLGLILVGALWMLSGLVARLTRAGAARGSTIQEG